MNAAKINRGANYENALNEAARRATEAVKEGYSYFTMSAVGFGCDEANRIETRDSIARAVELGLLLKTSDGKYAIPTIVETDIPFGEDEPRRTPPEAQPLEFAGMTCKNEKSAPHDGYWFYVGDEESSRGALKQLLDIGIDAGIKPHRDGLLCTLVFPYASELPKWARIDPNAPATVDFTSLAEEGRGDEQSSHPFGSQDGAESEGLRIGLHGPQTVPVIKPHHVHQNRKDFGCFLCEKGVDHLRYLGVSGRTGNRIWCGSSELVGIAKALANYKGAYTQSRPNGSKFWILTIEDSRPVIGENPFADMDLEELIGV